MCKTTLFGRVMIALLFLQISCIFSVFFLSLYSLCEGGKFLNSTGDCESMIDLPFIGTHFHLMVFKDISIKLLCVHLPFV